MPVDQTGETIAFVVEDGYVEAHIQIRYDGDAENFAWIVPLTAVPELGVGSQQLISNLTTSTVPGFGLTNSVECSDWGADDDGGDDEGTGGDGGAAGGDGSGGGEAAPKPKIVYEDTVGMFDAVVLEGGTASEVMRWLGENGYQQDLAAEPILEEYLADGFLFAAFKLHGNAETDQIHPVMIRYPGTEPCVPLRLTRIAAEEDMDVRVFFLADGRAAPKNYLHVWPNLVRLDWSFGANDYTDVITRAVDEAGGHAWVTEFAGSSCSVSTAGLISEDWEECELDGLAPTDVVSFLVRQGFARCTETGCRFSHPLVLPLLREFLPAPPEVDEAEYYLCVGCYQEAGLYQVWDAGGFADALRERIIEPARHARTLLEEHPYVTRLYTTISPDEMTVDPTFHVNPGLPEVGNQHVANRRILCESSIYELEDGRDVFVADEWPVLDMPYAELIEMIPAVGAPQVVTDNGAAIDEQVLTHGLVFGYVWDREREATPPSSPDCAPFGGDITQPSCDDLPADHRVRGCGCGVGRDADGPAWMGLLLLGLGVRRRRP